MKKLNYLTIVGLFVLVACAPDKNTNKSQKDYIINKPDFEELERKKAGLPKAKKPKPSQSKEDSLKAYIKELTHHFHLQEKQMKALEYIYAKYDKKEAKLNLQGDSVQLTKIFEEKEQSIEVVLGEHYYTRKKSFDKDYKLRNLKVSLSSILKNSNEKYTAELCKHLNLQSNKCQKISALILRYADMYKQVEDKKKPNILSSCNKALKFNLSSIEYDKKMLFDKTFFSVPK